jgi:hypothetical protein
MPRSVKVRSFAPKQCSSLFSLRFFGSNFPKPRLPNLFTGFRRANVVAHFASMAGAKMFFGCQAFKIFGSVVRLNTVNMVNVLIWVKRLKPTFSHNAVHKPTTTKRQITLVMLGGCVNKKFSENFSAARHSVKVVVKSIFDSVYLDASHVVPFRVVKESSF